MNSLPQYEPYRPIDTLSAAAQALVTYIRDNDHVTFAEMPRVLAPFFATQGAWAITYAEDPNVLFWANMSEPWVATLTELFAAQLLWREPCAALCYVIDGATLQLPLAKRPPKHGYATPHWAAVCVRPIEHIAPKERTRYGPTPRTTQRTSHA